MAAAVIMAVAMVLTAPPATRAAAGTTLTAAAVSMPAMARAIMMDPIMVAVIMPPASIWVASWADTVVAMAADMAVAVVATAAAMVAMAAADVTADASIGDLRENGPVSSRAVFFCRFYSVDALAQSNSGTKASLAIAKWPAEAWRILR